MSIRQTQEEWSLLSPTGKVAATTQSRLELIGMTATINNPSQPVFRAGTYLDAAETASIPVTRTATANQIHASLMRLRTGVTLNQLRFSVTTAGAALTTTRFGLYTLGPTFYPDKLLLDSGDLPTDAIAVVDYNFPTNMYFPPGWLAVANICNGTPTFRSFSRAATAPIPESEPYTGLSRNNIWYLSLAYGALPSTFPAGCPVFGIDTPQVSFRVV